MHHQPGAADRGPRPHLGVTRRRRGATTTRTRASSRRRLDDDAAGDPGGRAGRRQRAERRRGRGGAGEGRGAPRARRGRRAVREARGRGVGRGVEGERRASSGRSAGGSRAGVRDAVRHAEGRRRHPVVRTHARLPDLQARVATEPRSSRSTRRGRRSPTRWRTRSAAASSRSTWTKLRTQAIIEWKNHGARRSSTSRSVADGRGRGREGARARKSRRRGSGARLSTWPEHWLSGPRRAEQLVRDLDPLAPRAGRARAARRARASRRSCRRSPAGAAGRTARSRSTGRCFPATASRASTRDDDAAGAQVHGRRDIISFEGKPAPIPDQEIESIRLLVDERACSTIRAR